MPVDPGNHVLERRLEKLPPLESTGEALSVRAAYQQIDLNRHVNNAHYVGWILNSFPLEQYQRFHLAGLQINFLAETRLGEMLTICRERTGERESFSQGIEGRKDDGKTLAFQARLDWREAPVIS